MNHTLRRCRRPAAPGFTLIELMVVVAIIGLLATLVVTNVIDSAEKARRDKAAFDCAQLAGAARLFFIDRGRAPDLAELADRSGGRSYLEKVPLDPWGNSYVLFAEDTPPGFEVRCAGRNRVVGDEDDISSMDAAG